MSIIEMAPDASGVWSEADPYVAAACNLFSVHREDVTDKMRQVVKTIHHIEAYGGSVRVVRGKDGSIRVFYY